MKGEESTASLAQRKSAASSWPQPSIILKCRGGRLIVEALGVWDSVWRWRREEGLQLGFGVGEFQQRFHLPEKRVEENFDAYSFSSFFFRFWCCTVQGGLGGAYNLGPSCHGDDSSQTLLFISAAIQRPR